MCRMLPLIAVALLVGCSSEAQKGSIPRLAARKDGVAVGAAAPAGFGPGGEIAKGQLPGNAKAAELILNRLVGKPTAEPLSGDAAPELTAEEESEYLEHRRAEMLRRIQDDRTLAEIEVTEENMPEVKAMLQRRIDRLIETQDATPA